VAPVQRRHIRPWIDFAHVSHHADFAGRKTSAHARIFLPDLGGNMSEPELLGQTVVVIGGSAGIGLETARRARAEGAKLILAARDPERLEHASQELGTLSTAAFDATNFDHLKSFCGAPPTPSDHVLVTGPGPYYSPLAELDIEKARRDVEAHLLLPLQVARYAVKKVRPGG